ncbi:MAG: cellulase family glycosylhydrolase, partial [Candidatus Aadella gelida]|nr:cellulase family glycosylhydrolase [Candidatus Aadella gelida]
MIRKKRKNTIGLISKAVVLLMLFIWTVGTVPVFAVPTYTTYASGLMETKTMDDGTVYEYSNEDYLGDGYGLLTKETRLNDTYKTFSAYYAGTRQFRFVNEYDKDGNLSVIYEYDASGNFIGKTEKDTIYVFYPVSGRMASKTLDGTLFDYTDEDYMSEGYGLLTKETRPDKTYKTFTDYYALTRQYRYVKEYDASGDIVVTYEYDSSGNPIGQEEADGTIYTFTFYSSGLMETKTLPDETIYDYSNENWNSQGYGVLTKETRPDDTYKTFSDYFVVTDQAQYISEYDAAGTILVTYEYDSAGTVVDQKNFDDTVYTYYASGLMETKTLADETKYEYTDENHLTEGYGLLTKETRPNGTSKIFSNYFSDTRQPQYTNEVDISGNFVAKYEYDSVGNLISTTEANGTVYTYYASNRISSSSIPEGTFTKGMNLPWMSYGNDVGSQNSWYGFSTGNNKQVLIDSLNGYGSDVVRVFLFTDIRDVVDFSGPTLAFYDEAKLYADMDALIESAAVTDTKIIPTLFDYWIAYGSGSGDTGHPEVIKDSEKQSELMALIGTFVDHYKGCDEILMWDAMNEPYYGTSASEWGNQDDPESPTMST